MKLTFSLANPPDAAAIAALHAAVAEHLTHKFGPGHWSSSPSERAVLSQMRRPKFERIVLARAGSRIVGTLRLATKKPWAIDTAYFSPARRPLYLTGMAVDPAHQKKGVGRRMMAEAAKMARAWPGDAIRLDAYDAKAGARGFYAKCDLREVAHVVYKGNPLVYFEWRLE
jgi:GNAT superfamily N-acetyltransferase